MKLIGKRLTKEEQIMIFAGDASDNRCQRLINRSDRHRRRGDDEGARRLIAKFEELCADRIIS